MGNTTGSIEGAESSDTKCVVSLILELLRAEQASDPYAFRFAAQEYLLRSPGGGLESARFEWSDALLADLTAVRLPGRDSALAQRIGEVLRRFLATAGWAEREAQILQAVRAEQPVLLTLRFAAAELYALPWELLTIKSTGQHLGELPEVLLRYEWPETQSIAESTPRAVAGRILFAWSAAAGAVPASDHLTQLEAACQKGSHAFDRDQDVLANVSCERLITKLEAARKEQRPISVLHLLCHGAAVGSTYGLAFDSDENQGEQVVIDGGRLRQLLSPFASMLRLVVLCACDSGNSGALGNQLGSVAQTLHRAGIAAVVASRFPLSVAGSTRLTAELYTQLLQKLASLEDSLRAARQRLAQNPTSLDWASLQLYSRSTDGDDTHPLVFRPFRGLLAFQPEHHRFFFGREDVIDEIEQDLARLTTQAKPRFLVVAGASGTGKSSVVLAGALPRACEKNPALRFVILRPGSDPEKTLTDALRGFSDAAGPAWIIVDQFEEIFTHCESKAARQSFVRRLWQLTCDSDSQIIVIATLRVDFIGRCGEIALDDAGRALDAVAYDETHRVFVSQLSHSSLHAAIEQPARLCGLVLEEGLSQRMIEDVSGEPGALPLLQDTLDILWQRRSGNTLTQAAYDEVGGVAGALHRRADTLISSLSSDEQRVARRLLVRLVNVADDITLSTRRRLPIARLVPRAKTEVAPFERVLSQLTGARLLVRDGEGAAQLVEIAHEALIRKWPRLGEWVKADRKMLAALERIEAWVREWDRKDEDTLLNGSQLGFVEQFVKDYPGDLPDDAHGLLAASQALVRRRQQSRRLLQAFVGVGVLGIVMISIFGLYQASLVSKASTASRDTARMGAVRSLIDSEEPTLSLSLLRELETDQLESVKGFWSTSVELLRDVAYPETHWKLPIVEQHHTLFAVGADCTHVVVHDDMAPTVRLFERERAVATIELPKDADSDSRKLQALALSPDARVFAVFSMEYTPKLGTVRQGHLFSVESKSPAIALAGVGEEVLDAGFSPDGSQLLVLDPAGLVRAWKSDGIGSPTTYPVQRRVSMGSLLPPEDGYALATRNRSEELAQRGGPEENHPFVYGKTVELWGKTLRRSVVFERGGSIRATALCADQKRIATVGSQGAVTIWRLGKTPRELGLYVMPLSNVKAARLTSDGKKLVLGSADGTVQIWNSDGSERLLTLRQHAPVRDLVVSPDDKQLLILHSDRSVALRNLDGTGTHFVLPGTYMLLLPTSFSADGTRLALVDEERQVVVLDAATGHALRGFAALVAGRVNAVALRPNGKQLAWTLPGKFALTWNIDGPAQEPGRATFGGEEIVYSTDGSKLVIGSSAAVVRTYDADLSALQAERKLADFHGNIALSPDGERFALSGAGQLVFGRTSGDAPPIRHSHDALRARAQLVWSGDGSRLLTLYGNTALAWNTDGNQPATTLRIDDRSVQVATLSKDGKLAVLVGIRGIPWIFDLDRVDQLRPEQLRRRIWELGLGCRLDGRVEEFLNRSDYARTWDLQICHEMQRCVLNSLEGRGSVYERCFAEFKTQQISWLRELKFQTWFRGKTDLPTNE